MTTLSFLSMGGGGNFSRIKSDNFFATYEDFKLMLMKPAGDTTV